MAKKPTYRELDKTVIGRKLAEDKLRESEERYRTLFETMAQGVVYQDAQGKIISANPSAEKILGLSLDQMQGRTSIDPRWKSIHEDGSDFAGETHPSMVALNTGEEVKDVIMGVFNLQTEGYRWIRINAVPQFKEGEDRAYQVYTTFDDITERKQADQVVRDSEQKFKNIVESSPMGIHLYKLEQDGRLIFMGANPAADAILGIDNKQFIGKTIEEAFPPLINTEVPARYRLACSKGEPWQTEQINYEHDQIKGAYEVHAFQTAPGMMATLFLDITERMKTQEALQQSGERLRSFCNALPDLAFILDEDGRYVEILTAEEHLLYEDVVSLKGRLMTEILPKEVSKPALEMVRQTIRTGQSQVFEYKLDFPTEARWFEARTSTMQSSHSDKRLVTCLSRDITELKEAEEALRESEEKYRLIFDSATEGIVVIQDDVIRFINGRMLDIVGISKNEMGRMAGDSFLNFVYPDDRDIVVERYSRRLKGENLPSIYSVRFIGKNGAAVWVDISPVIISWEGNPAMLVFVTDISERIHAEEERKKLEGQLAQAQKMESIGTLAGGIAHDFNNILSAIIGFTEISMSDLERGSLLYNNLQNVLKAGERAGDLVSQILAFSRQSELEPKPVQVTLIAKEALKLLRATLPTTIGIHQNFKSHLAVMANPTQIHQVIMNLCTNAANAMQEKGGSLDVKLVDVDLDSEFVDRHPDINPGAYIKLTVSDTGHGMSPEVMTRIFDPFFTTKDKGEGTGMGLSVVHGIIKSHGGTITVESEPDKGSTFEVFIPAIESEVALEPESAVPLPVGTEQILFVDDEEFLVDIGKQMLERLGYRVVTKTSSLEALELFRAHLNDFDLVITDMTMPNMSGKDLAKELMVIRSDIPIILCTGFSEHIDEVKAKKMGISFVMKPIVLSQIANTIRAALDKK